MRHGAQSQENLSHAPLNLLRNNPNLENMKSIRLLLGLASFALLDSAAHAHDKAAPLDAGQKAFLAQYETLRAALAADDLAAAKTAAAPLAKDLAVVAKEQSKAQPAADAAKKLASAKSIADAREAFKAVSKRAVHYAEGKEGYYVANCPMVQGGEGDWVQTSKKISNPYFGKSMLACGAIK